MGLTLSDYINSTSANAQTSFHEHRICVESLELINEAFQAVLEVPALRKVGQVIFVAMSYSNFLAAAELALSGRMIPSHSMGRATVEAASYAFWTVRHPEHFTAWKDRNENDETRKRARRAFFMKPIIKAITAEQPAIGNQLQLSYDYSIDLGGHPNYSALVMGMNENSDGTAEWRFVESDITSIKFALLAVGHSGVTAMNVILQTFRGGLQRSKAGPKILAALNGWSRCERDLNLNGT